MASPQQGFPNLTQKEVGGEVTFNDFVRMNDALVPAVVQAVNVNTPPAGVEGKVWAIGTASGWPDSLADGTPTDGDLAQWYNGAWYYITPVTGYKVYNIADGMEYRFLGGAWVSVGAAHAGMSLGTPGAGALTSITPTPTIITDYDVLIPGQKGAVADDVAGTITINEQGIWIAGVVVTLDVVSDSSNQSREVAIELYNNTDAAVIGVFGYDTLPRYGASATIMGSLMFGIDAARVNDSFSLRIYSPSGHTITVNSIDTLQVFTFRPSHFAL